MAAPKPSSGPLQETVFSVPNGTRSSSQLPTVEPSSQNGYGTASSPRANGNGNAPASSPATRLLAPDLLRGLLMGFMAMDHNTFSVRSWPHGVGRDSEEASHVIRRWNYPIAIFVRELAHLCAPGFILLLGMGIVLLTQSRRKKGWTAPRLAKHMIVRGFVLTLVAALMGLILTSGQIWLMNAVLVAIAVDYTLVGLIWLGVEWTEGEMARALDKVLPDSTEVEDEEDAPLLHNHIPASGSRRSLWPPNPDSVAYYTGTFVLVVMFLVTLWWNIWFDPTHGHCPPEADYHPEIPSPESQPGDFSRFWLFVVTREHIQSAFPPLAWISPAILGVIYGRLVFVRPRPLSNNAMAIVNVTLGAVFAVLFVLTRLLHFGNLTEDCLRIDGHPLQPGQNQYLQSVAAFFYDSKYPPDPAFFFYALSGNFFLLALFGVIPAAFSRKWFKPLLAYGQSALFFYFVHFFAIMTFGSIFIAIGGHEVDFENPFLPGVVTGMDEWWAYWGNWAITMAFMWPLCNWYGNFKRTKGPDSLWRFF